VQTLRPEISPVFAAVVAKLLAKDPDHRYQSGEGLIDDLERLAADGGEALFPLGSRDGGVKRSEVRLVGRQVELGELLSRWDKARAGRGGVALICGAAGGGKSRLVREVVAVVRAGGGLVLEGKAEPDEAMPLAPLRSAVDRYLGAVGQLPEPERSAASDRVRAAATSLGPLLGTLSPALADPLGTREPYGEDRQAQFIGAVATFLVGLAKQSAGAVLCLDDVQWLDAATLRLLHSLAQDLAESGLLVIGTARDDGVNGASVDALAADLGGALDTRIQLAPLSEDSASQFLAESLGGAAVAPAFRRLAARCDGNPFTLGEYLRAVVDAGLIRPSWGVWQLEERGLDALALAPDVLHLIVSRADNLGADSDRVLATAAAIGMRFRVDQLARVCGVDERKVLEVIRVAIDSRLVGTAPRGEYAFVHDRVREALLADIAQSTLRLWHQRIAEVLEASPSAGPEQVYAVARHYLASGLTTNVCRVW
jgi:predicted ATPase